MFLALGARASGFQSRSSLEPQTLARRVGAYLHAWHCKCTCEFSRRPSVAALLQLRRGAMTCLQLRPAISFNAQYLFARPQREFHNLATQLRTEHTRGLPGACTVKKDPSKRKIHMTKQYATHRSFPEGSACIHLQTLEQHTRTHTQRHTREHLQMHTQTHAQTHAHMHARALTSACILRCGRLL